MGRQTTDLDVEGKQLEEGLDCEDSREDDVDKVESCLVDGRLIVILQSNHLNHFRPEQQF